MTSGPVLAIVPARGGSKSIPGKNIRTFAGHPLVAWSIAAGQVAETVDRVIVSTDDERIADVAKQYGAEVPFMRPRALALDDTHDLPVFEHALGWLDREEEYRPEVVVQLRPTSPIRPLDCVDGAVRTLLENPGAESVRGVVPSGQNPFKMWKLEGGELRPLLRDPPEAYNMPRQLLPQTYWQTGHVDAIRPRVILEAGSMSGDRILPWLLAPEFSFDIDTPADWVKAEGIVKEGMLTIVRPGALPRRLPRNVELLVLDFDGVLTDDRVWVTERGEESVAAHRGDGHGIGMLKKEGIQIFVISRESNPTVAARCEKLGIDYLQGVEDKGRAMAELLETRNVGAEKTVFVGNDITDLPCFPLAGCGVAVADAHPQVRAAADLILSRRGGQGAVREICDLILDVVQT